MNTALKLTRQNQAAELRSVYEGLRKDGVIVLQRPEENIASFGGLMTQLCETLTFDPAREHVSSAVQKVDAGTSAVGLHIENGNTPLPPDIVAFFSRRSAPGANTTVCDGVEVLAALPAALRKQFERPFSMRRYLSSDIWRRYVATALEQPIDTITSQHLEQFIAMRPGQSFRWAEANGIDYQLHIPAIRTDNLAGKAAFANALLGPSYNYAAPIYRFEDGTVLSEGLLEEIRAIGERFTREIPWRDGDVAIIDNKRVMHGRRQINVPLSERELFIAMGLTTQPPLSQSEDSSW